MWGWKEGKLTKPKQEFSRRNKRCVSHSAYKTNAKWGARQKWSDVDYQLLIHIETLEKQNNLSGTNIWIFRQLTRNLAVGFAGLYSDLKENIKPEAKKDHWNYACVPQINIVSESLQSSQHAKHCGKKSHNRKDEHDVKIPRGSQKLWILKLKCVKCLRPGFE